MKHLPVEYNYWTLTRRYLTLPPDRIMTTREIARLLGTSSPGVTARMRRYHIRPEVQHITTVRILHKWNTNEILLAAQQEWGTQGHHAPVSQLKAEQIIAHITHLRKTQTVKNIAESVGLSPNILAKWTQRQTTPSIGQVKALLEKYPMLY